MLSEERTDATKLFYFALFVAINGISCITIPFILDYAYNFLNGLIIPDSLLWDDNNRIRADLAGWFTAQVLIVIVEFISLFWLLYRLNRWNTAVWLAPESVRVVRLVSGFVVVLVAIATLFARGDFLIWLVKKYSKTIIEFFLR